MLRVLQAFLLMAVFGMVPLGVGSAFRRRGLMETYVFGQVFMWALFQILAVPLVLLRLSFDALWISYALALLPFFIMGICRIRKQEIMPKVRPDLWTCAAVFVILFQAGMYLLGQHVDEDDARWIAEANDALLRNRMLLDNPATGRYIGHFAGEMLKDVFSPFSMYMAVLSRWTMIRPPVMAHTLYAPVLLLISYMLCALTGRELFSRKREQGIFVLGCAVVNLFYAGNTMTQSVFTLTRIWQGKAVVAAVIMPLFLLLFLRLSREQGKDGWLWLAAAGTGACLFSGMGVPAALILTCVYGGCVLISGRVRQIPYLLLCMVLPVLYGLGYFWLKGGLA